MMIIKDFNNIFSNKKVQPPLIILEEKSITLVINFSFGAYVHLLKNCFLNIF